MRAVKSLIEELKKFPEDAYCKAYEGETNGIIVMMDEAEHNYVGFIHLDMDKTYGGE